MTASHVQESVMSLLSAAQGGRRNTDKSLQRLPGSFHLQPNFGGNVGHICKFAIKACEIGFFLRGKKHPRLSHSLNLPQAHRP